MDLTLWALSYPTLSVRRGLAILYEEAYRGLRIFYESAQIEQTGFSLKNILIVSKINYVVTWKALTTISISLSNNKMNDIKVLNYIF